jgi:prevent-host-death family protein
MQEFPAATLTRDPISLKEAARKHPVAITEHKRPRFVLMSYEAYLSLTASRNDPRLALRTSEMPEDLKALMLEALDQPYEP